MLLLILKHHIFSSFAKVRSFHFHASDYIPHRWRDDRSCIRKAGRGHFPLLWLTDLFQISVIDRSCFFHKVNSPDFLLWLLALSFFAWVLPSFFLRSHLPDKNQILLT